jgi:predicted RNA polymerase sigma factor
VQEIARAFLISDATTAQRLVRAKRLLRDEGIGLDLPQGSDLGARLESVLDVIYLLFNEGYGAHVGADLVRQDLCGEALRLGRLVTASPATGAPAAHALVALKGRLLLELGDRDAAACYRDALARPCSEPERRFLARRLRECASQAPV